MGWYANEKARRAAAKAGLPTPLNTGLGDKIDAGLAEQEEREDRMKARAIAEDEHNAVKGARKAKKRERKLGRRGTAGPS